MILKIKFKFFKIFKLISLLILSNISNLNAHNLYNGGCKDHCGQLIRAIINKNRLNNLNDQIDFENKNSCLNKSLCRG